MAKAPRPKKGGYDALKKRQERAKEAYRITIRESNLSFVYRPYGIPTYVRGHVRDVTGRTVEELLWERGSVDAQTYCDIWWITRLCNDETVQIDIGDRTIEVALTRRHVQDEWDERFPGITKDDIEDVSITGQADDSPEA